MTDKIVGYRVGTSYGMEAGLVSASINPTPGKACKLFLEWAGDKMLLAYYNPTEGFFSASLGSPILCPADVKIVIEGDGSGTIVWRPL